MSDTNNDTKMAITIKDVAAHAKVAVMSVSNVINNKPYVSEKIRERVKRAIDELGYVPNETARKLREKKTGLVTKTGNIGCLIFGSFNKFSNPYYAKIMEAMENEITNQNYHLLFSYTEGQLENRASLPAFFNQVDGLIIAGRIQNKLYDFLKGRGLLMISVDAFYGDDTDCITIDKVSGAYRATNYLIQLGHKRIGFIGRTSSMPLPNIRERIDGYREALIKNEIAFDREIVKEGADIEGGRLRTEEILKSAKIPTAIFAYSDSIAAGIMKAARALELNVPEDISVIGFNGDEMGTYLEPPLTTISIPRKEMGVAAVNRLIERIKDDSSPARKTIFPVKLVVRGSTLIKK